MTVCVPRRVHLPSVYYEWTCFLIFWFGGLWVLYYEMFVVSPYYHSAWNSTMTLHLVISLFLASNIYTNMFLFISTNVSYKQINNSVAMEGDPPPPGWKYCEKCNMNVPPRSHHCKLCNECILKRDHHCFFAGYCVGHFNHRYFIAMVVHMTIAAIYGNVYNWQFFLHLKGGFSWTTIPALLAPHMGLMLGYYSIYEFFMTANTFIGVGLLLLFVTLLVTQIMYCYTGQLHYEKKKGIADYAVGARKTYREVFGSAGLWVLLCPLIPSQLPGDGTSFPTVDDTCHGDKTD